MTAPAFDTIYRDNLWGGGASRSGPGSSREATSNTARSLQVLVSLIGSETVLDVGCGDGLWMPDLPGYVGLDASAEAVSRARKNHPDRRYELAPRILPPADLVVVRDVIQHLSLDDGVDLLRRSWEAATWLLMSTYVDGRNVAIHSGLDGRGRFTFYRPDMSADPFSLGPPLLLLQDGWDYETGSRVRDAGKFLGLWCAS